MQGELSADSHSGDKREAVHENTGGVRTGPDRKPVARWEIEYLANDLDVDGVVEPALDVYEAAFDVSEVWFREIATVASAAFYIVCRREDQAIPLRTVGKASHSAAVEIGGVVTDLQRELDLVVLPPPPEAFIATICDDLDLPEDIGEHAKSLLETSQEIDPSFTSGRPPAGIAAGSLYTVCRREDYRVTQHELADIVDACVTTIRDVYHFQAELE